MDVWNSERKAWRNRGRRVRTSEHAREGGRERGRDRKEERCLGSQLTEIRENMTVDCDQK